MGYRVKGEKENAGKGAGARFNDTTFRVASFAKSHSIKFQLHSYY